MFIDLFKKAWRDFLGVAFVGLFGLGLALWTQNRRSAPQQVVRAPGFDIPHPAVTLPELKQLLASKRAVIIDARAGEHYEEGHIPGAISLDIKNFDFLIAGFKSRHPDKSALLIVYCDSALCGVSDDLQQRLIDHGYSHVGIYRDGWKGWSSNGPDLKAGS